MKVDKVLVPLAGSPLAEMALPTAIELLRDSPDATLVLLRAAEVTTLPGVDGESVARPRVDWNRAQQAVKGAARGTRRSNTWQTPSSR